VVILTQVNEKSIAVVPGTRTRMRWASLSTASDLSPRNGRREARFCVDRAEVRIYDQPVCAIHPIVREHYRHPEVAMLKRFARLLSRTFAPPL
jgi:hypothetical protein